MRRTISLLFLIIFTISNHYGFSYSPNSGNYFSIGIGYLLEQGNPFLKENLFIFQASDGIKISEKISVNINFTISFPDERLTFTRLRTFGNLEVYNVDWIVKFSTYLNFGFENTSYFVNIKITNEIPFKYYSTFIPYISGEITLSSKLILEIFSSLGIVAGIPFLFLPNIQPYISSIIYFQTYQVGIKNLILDEISVYYDQTTLSLLLTKRF